MKEVELEDKISECEQLIQDCKIHIKKRKVAIIDKLLHKFDFARQKAAFREFWQRKAGKGVGTFLIHGEEYSGQQWIYQRLLERIQVKTEKIIIRPKPSRRPYGIVGLIEVLSAQLNLNLSFLSPNPSIAEVTLRCQQLREGLITRLQKSSIVICLHDSIDFLNQSSRIRHFRDKNHLNLFIELFWKPLCQAATKVRHNNKLVIFLIEEKIYPEDFPHFSNEPQQSIEAVMPLQLPPIEVVSETYIQVWTENHVMDSEHYEMFTSIEHYQDIEACRQCLSEHSFLSPIDFFHHIHHLCNDGHVPYELYY